MNTNMNAFLLCLAFFLGIGVSAFSQDTTCNCLDNLNKTIEKTEENYAGFPAKVNLKTKQNYDNLIKLLRRKASTKSDSKNCFYVIKNYIKFLKTSTLF